MTSNLAYTIPLADVFMARLGHMGHELRTRLCLGAFDKLPPDQRARLLNVVDAIEGRTT
jgi:hypothetical protein